MNSSGVSTATDCPVSEATRAISRSRMFKTLTPRKNCERWLVCKNCEQWSICSSKHVHFVHIVHHVHRVLLESHCCLLRQKLSLVHHTWAKRIVIRRVLGNKVLRVALARRSSHGHRPVKLRRPNESA